MAQPETFYATQRYREADEILREALVNGWPATENMALAWVRRYRDQMPPEVLQRKPKP